MSEVNYCNNCPSGTRGDCCYHSMFDGKETHIATEKCKYLNKAGRCEIYKKRFEINPACLTIEEALQQGALPEACAYVQATNIVPNKPWKKRETREKWNLKKKIL